MNSYENKRRFVLPLLAALLVIGSADTPAASVTSTLTIPIAGTVTASPESVSLSGSIQIVNTLVRDSLLGSPPKVRLSIKLVNVSGVGLSTGTKYVATGEDTLLRLLKISDSFEITFPFYRDTPNGRSSARSALAAITLKFDLLSGTLSGATASFSTPSAGV
jgi:hypothetical protein